MNKEIIEIFSMTDKKCFIDCTLGLGGHSHEILKAFPNSKIIGLDLDSESLSIAEKNLGVFSSRISLMKMNFLSLTEKPDLFGQEISGVLIDPGISMFQLQNAERGFSHNKEEFLDMRKDKAQETTAFDVINTFNESKLAEIFINYGEVSKARLLAKKIIEARLFKKTIQTTLDLKNIINQIYPPFVPKGKSHPAAKVFMALRIYINRELEGLEIFTANLAELLKTGARIIWLTYHSLEDRIIKKTFRELAKEKMVSLIKPFPSVPAAAEIAVNSASRSAKLRAAEVI
jgi:16S rRNA (cytosine1402-N4)-methyltransferase